MSRNTLVFGNGLGMALDPNFFKLENAMKEVWENPNGLSAPQKEQILRCLNVQGIDDQPRGEDNLDVLHVAVMACKFLDKLGSERIRWLSADGQTFPNAIEKYITSVGWHFHDYAGSLPQPFAENLADFINRTESHIATLNYDNLLYQKLIELDILRGYDGPIIDGFHTRSNGFHAENLERLPGRTFGYYLHLHGSPLFIQGPHYPKKQLQRSADHNISTPHLVLAHVKHKPSIIANSFLLTAYWRYFERGIRESVKIILFGYSGLDLHLNQVITENSNSKEIIVVEWDGMGKQATRSFYWNAKMKTSVKLIRIANILEFTAWDSVGQD